MFENPSIDHHHKHKLKFAEAASVSDRDRLVSSAGVGECFFPFEYHGTYAVQSAPNRYSEVLIEINRILPYGFCHKKVDNNLILRDG